MSLSIYTAANSESKLSSGSYENPLRATLDSKQADVFETLLYLRSDEGSFVDISLMPVSTTTGKDIVNSGGYAWKLKAGSTQPTPQEWATINGGNEITFSNVLDTNTYLPFWLRIEIPKGAMVDSYQHVSLRITCDAVVFTGDPVSPVPIYTGIATDGKIVEIGNLLSWLQDTTQSWTTNELNGCWLVDSNNLKWYINHNNETTLWVKRFPGREEDMGFGVYSIYAEEPDWGGPNWDDVK